VLASAEFAAAHAKRRGLRLAGLPQILGWGHRSADLPFQTKLDRAPEQGLLFPHVAQAFGDALRRAGLASVRQLDGLEVHDCFAMTEVLLVEHAGLTAPGGAAAAYARGEFALGGAFPVNPSGGLIGGGHPVGATGVRMLLDAVQQVRGAAGGYQVEGARRFGTYNIGGAFGTVCSFVVGSA
jgi:acetyl-CoA C-acetyltransferase